MASTLDEVSNGRVTPGVGAGWHQPEFDAFGYDFDHRVDRLEEALQVMKPLLQGGACRFCGKALPGPQLCDRTLRHATPAAFPC